MDWLSIDVRYHTRDDRAWLLEARGLRLGAEGPSADLRLACAKFSWSQFGQDCAAAELQLEVDGERLLALDGLRWRSLADGVLELHWDGPAEHAALTWSGGFAEPLVELELRRFDLAELSSFWPWETGLDVLEGELSLALSLNPTAVNASMRWTDGMLDGLDGRLAAEGLVLDVDLMLELDSLPARVWRLAATQHAGELLADSIYLPSPAVPMTLSAAWSAPSHDHLQVTDFYLDDPGSVAARGNADLRLENETWQLSSLVLEHLNINLAHFWPRWMEGPAATAGWGSLGLAGALGGSLQWQSDHLQAADLRITALALEDPRARLGLDGLSVHLQGAEGRVQSAIQWNAAQLWGLPLGGTEMDLLVDEVGVRLLQAVSIPVLDGAIGIDSLAWFDLEDLPSQLVFDARIEPISLNLLTRELGLVELGGNLAGHFPGVQYQDQRLAFTGDIEIDAFSGRISLSELEIERPFGTLPALAAQVEFDRLDLLELTGAFDFGRMEGQMSGWMRDLRLLDWRPVAMDTRLFTHADVRRRRISQRAIDDLSSLGGAGGALLTGTVLRVFDDFPYRRAGLACRLVNNICYIDGVAPHPSGGFYIVEGRGLPRLDVVGHRRLVDFPQVLRQLETIRARADD